MLPRCAAILLNHEHHPLRRQRHDRQPHRDAPNDFRESKSIAWTVLSPAAIIEPGQRTGKFRLGTDQLIMDARGHSRISAEDYAIAFMDEVEQAKHIRRRFTVGY